MYQNSDGSDWFTFLSGSDYTTQPPQAVLDQLANGGFDAYLDHRPIVYPLIPDPTTQYERHGFKSAGWVPVAYDRYIAIQIWLPGYSWRRKKPIRIPVGIVRSKSLVSPFNPFSEALRCFGGDAWITGNRRTAERILAQNDTNLAILAHYFTRFAPDESLTHTILCNQPDLRISADNLRYIDWSIGGHHPKILGMEDIPRIFASKAHFARKFDLAGGTKVLDAIDQAVDSAARLPG